MFGQSSRGSFKNIQTAVALGRQHVSGKKFNIPIAEAKVRRRPCTTIISHKAKPQTSTNLLAIRNSTTLSRNFSNLRRQQNEGRMLSARVFRRQRNVESLRTLSNSSKAKSFLKRAVEKAQTKKSPESYGTDTTANKIVGNATNKSVDPQVGTETGATDFASYLILLAEVAAAACMTWYVVPRYIVEVTECEGPSMMPTIYPLGDIVLVEKMSHRFHGLKDGACAEDRILAEKERQRTRRRQMKKMLRQQEKEDAEKHRQTDNHILLPKRSNTTTIRRTSTEGSVPTLQSEIRNEEESHWTIQKFFNRISSPLSHGDVVIVQHPLKTNGTVCKRILALPGDTVIKRERVQYWDSTNSNDYDDDIDEIPPPWFVDTEIITIPDGHVWLEGDNPENSRDSREYGPVPFALVQGRTILRLWPLRGNALFGMERKSKPRNFTVGKSGSSDDVDDHYEDLRSRVILAGQ